MALFGWLSSPAYFIGGHQQCRCALRNAVGNMPHGHKRLMSAILVVFGK